MIAFLSSCKLKPITNFDKCITQPISPSPLKNIYQFAGNHVLRDKQISRLKSMAPESTNSHTIITNREEQFLHNS